MNRSAALITLATGRGNQALVAFPPAGAGATFYTRVLEPYLPGTGIFAAQYPGRQSRMHEPAVERRSDLVVEAVEAICAVASQRGGLELTLLGHSLGAQVAYEVGLALQEVPQIRLDSVILSALSAPGAGQIPGLPDPYTDSDAQLLCWLHSIGGVPEVILREPELSQMVAQAVRADLRASTLELENGMLHVPLTLICGDRDPLTSLSQMANWAQRSTCETRLVEIAGDHDALRTDAASWVGRVVGEMSLG